MQSDIPWRAQGRHPGAALLVRLVVHRKTPEQARRSQKELVRAATKCGRTPDPRSLDAARYVPLLTSLDRDAHPAQAVAALYRFRRQVELAFKRWKSLAGLDALPTKDPGLARA